MRTEEVELGMYVCDKATNITGYIVDRVEKLGVGVQFSIQPPGNGKEMVEAWTFDAVGLEEVRGIEGRKPLIDMQPAFPDMGFSLGATVRDISGFEGIATHSYHCINGCVLITITGKPTKATGQPPVITVGLPRITLVRDVPKTERVKTGGPSTLSVRP